MPVRNVLLITMDAVRADRLGCYGGGFETPYLDALAAKGVRFRNAISAANVTDPSHASILTSTYPTEHGVRLNGVRFRALIPTLAEVLTAKGYATMAAVSVEHLSSYFGLDRGFETYYNNSPLDRLYYHVALRPVLNRMLVRLRRWRNLFRRSHWRKGDKTTQDVMRWLGRHHSEPFFVWVHYFDAHNYSDVNDYGAKVRYVDSQIGKIVDGLRHLGVLAETAFVVTSDHGELLWDRDNNVRGHGWTLCDAEVRVPLIVSPFPQRPGFEVLAQVRTIDIAPTIVDLLGTSVPQHWQGVTLAPWMSGNERGNLTAFVMSCGVKSDAYCVRTGRWKFVLDESDGESLYDLCRDPDERCNVVSERSEIAAKLRETLLEWWCPDRGEPYAEREAAVVQDMLRGLGYLE